VLILILWRDISLIYTIFTPGLSCIPAPRQPDAAAFRPRLPAKACDAVSKSRG